MIKRSRPVSVQGRLHRSAVLEALALGDATAREIDERAGIKFGQNTQQVLRNLEREGRVKPTRLKWPMTWTLIKAEAA